MEQIILWLFIGSILYGTFTFMLTCYQKVRKQNGWYSFEELRDDNRKQAAVNLLNHLTGKKTQ